MGRKEALERRQEFLKENEDLHMKIKSTDFKITNVKTRQQLEQERESFFQSTVKRVQEEATMISNRAKEDEMKRVEFLKERRRGLRGKRNLDKKLCREPKRKGNRKS